MMELKQTVVFYKSNRESNCCRDKSAHGVSNRRDTDEQLRMKYLKSVSLAHLTTNAIDRIVFDDTIFPGSVIRTRAFF